LANPKNQKTGLDLSVFSILARFPVVKGVIKSYNSFTVLVNLEEK